MIEPYPPAILGTSAVARSLKIPLRSLETSTGMTSEADTGAARYAKTKSFVLLRSLFWLSNFDFGLAFTDDRGLAIHFCPGGFVGFEQTWVARR